MPENTTLNSTDSVSIDDVYFAKQPIYDNQMNLFGFEILYRNSAQNQAEIINEKNATIELLANYCLGLFEDVTQPYVRIFINMDHELIMSEIFLPLPPENIIIEISDKCKVDDALLIRISELKQKGYVFAMPSSLYLDALKKQILIFCDYIKIDVARNSSEVIDKMITEISQLNQQKVTFVAEKVETLEQMQFCKDRGSELFQGHLLSFPQMVKGKRVSKVAEHSIRLLSMLYEEEHSIQVISEQVALDPKLSFQVLKIINSPVCRLPKVVNSIQEAVIFLGLAQLKYWVTILTITNASESSSSLMQVILERAKFCELISERTEGLNSQTGFTVGLFSEIDRILNADKSWLLNKIGLSDEIKCAITERKGPFGKILDTVTQFEDGNLVALMHRECFDFPMVYSASQEAHRWSVESLKLCEGMNTSH